MGSFSRVRDESNQISLQFLLTELETAFTFLQVAETTAYVESRERNRKHAREAYDSILRMQPRVIMEPAGKAEFQSRLSELKSRLEGFGFDLA